MKVGLEWRHEVAFDQNISYQLIRRLEDLKLDFVHVKEVGLENATDKLIWAHAKENSFSIVTFDVDFYDFALVWGFPPRIIRLRTVNQTTSNVEMLLRRHQGTIEEFLDNSGLACLEIIERNPETRE